MKLIPMGEYYLWHCDWCDSTNYTLWSHLGADKPACAACHQHPGTTSKKSAINSRYPAPDSRPDNFNGIAC